MKKALLVTALLGSAILAGCAEEKMAATAPKDGELAMPADYTSWPVFISGIEKSSGHIRDIYINNVGTKAEKGDAFPSGTQFVMEIHNAESAEDGSMSKTGLAKVFVMAKGEGYGAEAKTNNGEWVYSAFDGSGKALGVDYESCRACHAPLADKDYVFHYDKYFDMKASAGAPSYAEMLKSHAGLVAMNETEVTQVTAVLK